jgi:hypothetical protein
VFYSAFGESKRSATMEFQMNTNTKVALIALVVICLLGTLNYKAQNSNQQIIAEVKASGNTPSRVFTRNKSQMCQHSKPCSLPITDPAAVAANLSKPIHASFGSRVSYG